MSRTGRLLYAGTVVAFAAAGMGFEIVAGALGGYVLGEGVTQFSLAAGLYMAAMGAGAWASRHAQQRPQRLVECMLASALAGGCTPSLVYIAVGAGAGPSIALRAGLCLTGFFVGALLPLYVALLRMQGVWTHVVSRALSLDYAGALVGSLAAGAWLVPAVGPQHASLVFAVLMLLCAVMTAKQFGGLRRYALALVATTVVLAAVSGAAARWMRAADETLLGAPVFHTQQTKFQRVVFTRARGGFDMYLDGNLQFASVDEHRYHEALVHPVLAATASPTHVLVLGGGDGLAVRELLKDHRIADVLLVDLDPGMTELATTFPPLVGLNERALRDPRVRVQNEDALRWLLSGGPEAPRYDTIVVDFPDPNHYALGKLYTQGFYESLAARLTPHGRLVVQATSPLSARKSYWCIAHTLQAAGWVVRPYHVTVPTFGEWGYILAAREEFEVPTDLKAGPLRFLDNAVLSTLFTFGLDMREVQTPVNVLNHQELVHIYEQEWHQWVH